MLDGVADYFLIIYQIFVPYGGWATSDILGGNLLSGPISVWFQARV